MKRNRLVSRLVICAAVIGALLLSYSPVAAQNKNSPVPPYNPYPAGILPGDLDSEIKRVLREVDFIERRGLARWHALEPPTLTGQPPTFQNTGTEAIETLGVLSHAR
jgi:hypothetical protein